MIYLIKVIFFLLISHYSFASENISNQILFKINNKVFTDIDLEERIEFVALVNNLIPSKFSEIENREIYNDYTSSLIFYEYYIQNKIIFENINNEVDLIYEKNLQLSKNFDEFQIKKFKFNTKIDLIRNKIIERKLNSNKESLIKEVNKNDLLYNYILKHMIINEKLLEKKVIKNIDDSEKFDNLKNFLIKNKINFFYKEDYIEDNNIISNKIKKIINQNIPIYIDNENGYINLISIKKNLVSYEGIFVKLINFKLDRPLEKKDLQCDKLNEKIDINKTVFKEYEYSSLNNDIKNSLKTINDFILFKNNDEYNYVILCDLTYDEKLLKNINFNKNVNSLVNKIQRNFLKKYKNEYNFIEIK